MSLPKPPTETDPQPAVTICIPSYNQRPEYLKDAINSALAQTVPVEVVIVDDGSTVPIPPNGPTRVRVIRHEQNRGIAAALNTSIEATRTPWWCWLSSDDTIFPNKVAVQFPATLEAQAKASFHRWMLHGSEPPMVSPTPTWRSHRTQKRDLAINCWVNGSTVMIHRDVFREVGLFDPSFRYGQDWEMWNRIAHKFEWHFIPDVLGSRHEGENLTARIAQDPALRARRDEEDRLIRERYLPR